MFKNQRSTKFKEYVIVPQEKHGKDKNAALEHDFKTLADVLIQV